MGETPGSPTVSMKLQRIAGPGSAQLCAKRGVACLVRHWRKLVVTEEPDALIALVRVCGEGAGEPVPLPGKRPPIASAPASLRLSAAPEAQRSAQVPPEWKGGTPATMVISKIAFEFPIRWSLVQSACRSWGSAAATRGSVRSRAFLRASQRTRACA